MQSASRPLPPPEVDTLAALLLWRCEQHPHDLAYAYVRDTLEQDARWTYAELLQQARTAAAHIAARTRPGDRVLLAHPAGLAFVRDFWGCVLSGRIAVPVPAPDPVRAKNSLPRLQAIIDDAEATLVLTTADLLPAAAQAPGPTPWCALDGLDPLPQADADPAVTPHDVAYLQYTSGSTSAPRGAILTHANVVAQCRGAVAALAMGRDSRALCWLPQHHDYGLVSGLLWPLHAGAASYLMSPLTFLRRPLRWLDAIGHFGITHTGAPNFAYAACTRALQQAPSWRGRLDSLLSATCGAEPIQHETIRRFEAAFGPHGWRRTAFAAGYGMAETVLTVTLKPADGVQRVEACDAEALAAGRAEPARPGRPARLVIGCGRAIDGMEMRIVDPKTRRECAARQVGEIWVRGSSVGRGYWRQAQDGPNSFDARTAKGAGPFLRTGDLGFVDDGELFVTGRLKDLIIIRGRNHYPQDIEWTAQRTHAALRQGYGAAFAIEGPDAENGERLVLVQELERRVAAPDLPAIAAGIRRAIAEEHDLPVHAIALVRSGSVPRTSSGKIRRSSCKQDYLAGRLEILHLDLQAEAEAAPDQDDAALLATLRAEVEASPDREAALGRAIRRLAARLLRRDPQDVPLDANLFEAGLDSLSTFRLAHQLEQLLDRELPPGLLLQQPNLGHLAHALAAPAPVTEPARPEPPLAPPASRQPLSATQEGVWFVERLAGPSAMYNIAQALHIDGPLDMAALQRSLQALVARHDALRTGLQDLDGAPTQTVTPAIDLPLPVTELPPDTTGQALQRLLEQHAREPFDLAWPPLLRARLFRLDARRHVLLLVVHHLVADGWSMGVIARELGRLYAAHVQGEVPSLPAATPYGAFVRWQREHLDQGAALADIEHWRERLAGLQPLELPTDHPRPPRPSHAGGMVTLELPEPLVRQLRTLARDEGASLFMVLLAAFKTLLMRYTGQDDIAVGSPVAARLRPEFQDTVGFFSNTLVLRTDLGGDPGFRELLARVRATALDAYAHQSLPSDKLVAALGLPRDPSRNALYQVAFALQNMPDLAMALEGAKVSPLPLHTGTAKIDLWASFFETDGALRGEFEYSRDLFEPDTIERLARHYRHLLEAVVRDPAQPVSRLPLLDEVEWRQIVHEWNATSRPYPLELGVHQLFGQIAREHPHALAARFDGQELSYAELDRLSNQAAHLLAAHGVAPGSLVAVAMERSLELVVALMAVLKAGAAFVPLDPDYPAERLAFMLQDSAPSALLTQPHTRERLPATAIPAVVLDGWQLLQDQPTQPPAVTTRPDDLAYVIYTSGSTGQPKGALLTHKGLTNHILWLRETLRLDAGDRVLQKTSISFDAAIWEFFTPLAAGAAVVLARPGEHLDTGALVRTLEAESITAVQMVPSALRALLDEPGLSRCTRLRHLISGGEALERGLAREVLQRLPGVTLGNFYGPSEASDDATHYELTAPPEGPGLVPIGKPIANVRCHILDAHGQPVPIGVPGELYIGGAGVGRGYLGREALTAERFVPDPFHPGERLYRTGDRARYLRDGHIEFLGRLDAQVKLRGFRIELGEVEAALNACEGVQHSAVVLREDRPGQPQLVAYVVAPGVDPAALRARLQARLPHYMVPAAFVGLDALPRLPNGKLNRRALPAPAPQAEDAARVAPRNPVEQILWDIWRDVLGHGDFGVHDGFFELGGHSLQATQVVSRVRQVMQAELPLRALFEAPTIARLARLLDAPERARALLPAIERVPRDGPLPVSFSQRRMWLVQQMAPHSTAYNMPCAVRLRGRLDRAALQRALDALVERHEAFRTTLEVVGSEPMQFIHPPQPVAITEADFSHLPADQRERQVAAWLGEQAGVPFDLARYPLHRTFLARLDEDDHVMMWLAHHAIGDQWSGMVLLREFAALYQPGKATLQKLPAPEIGYVDYAVWQRRHFDGAALAGQLEYWRRQLAGIEPLALPFDRPRPAQPSFRGSHAMVELSPQTRVALQRFSARHGATPFMTLLACFQLLLARYTGGDDIAVGTPIANRTHYQSEHLIGTLVNTLVMRTSLADPISFTELLARVRSTALDAYAHQDIAFDHLVEVLEGNRQSEHPLNVSVLFNVLNAPMGQLRLDGLTPQPFDFDRGSAQFDLSLHVDTEVTGRAYLEYSTDLFLPETAQRLLDNYVLLLEQVLADPGQPVTAYRLCTDAERAQLARWNDTGMGYDPAAATIPQLLAGPVQRHPAAVALRRGPRSLTYAELEALSNRLAHALRARGISRGQLVGLCLERSPEMLVAQLAILKAGAAYVPLDPAFPAERLAYMAQDAQLALLLTQSSLTGLLPWPRERTLLVDADAALLAAQPDSPPPADELAARPEDAAYVIYTSGSTGRPKGVVVPHRAVVNFLLSMARAPGLSASDRLLAVTTLSFDIAVLELLLPLSVGAQIVLASRDEAMDGQALCALLLSSQATVMQATPATWRMLVEAGWAGSPAFKALIGGEPLPPDLAAQLLERCGQLWNMYGPTETTVWSTIMRITDARDITIGRPIANTQVHILDPRGQPCPIGVPGEICIGGDGVTLGYLRRPELTAERFIDDPWRPGARLYRTGDRGRWRHDGLLEHHGRMDFQVKVRGYRIELGEIEANLATHPQVARNVVIVREDRPGDARLVAYVVPRDEMPGAQALREHLRQSLPEYMLPQHYVQLQAIPLLPNGKIDRKALPAPTEASADASAPVRDAAAPRTPAEAAVAEIWKRLLGIEHVSPSDNFFDLGGHSLLAMRAVGEMEAALGSRIPVRRLIFETLAQIAASMAPEAAPPPRRSWLDRLPRSRRARARASVED